MPRIKETILYKFSELSPEAQARAIEKYREDMWLYDDMQIYFDDLRYELKHTPNYVAEFSDEYCLEHGASMLQEYCKLNAIYSVEIERLDTSRNDCRLQISFHDDIVLKHLVSQIYKENPTKMSRILALIEDGRIDFGYGDQVQYYGRSSIDNHLDSICKQLDRDFTDTISDLVLDYEHWLLRITEAQEEFISSDEYIREAIEASDYEFDIEGNMD